MIIVGSADAFSSDVFGSILDWRLLVADDLDALVEGDLLSQISFNLYFSTTMLSRH